MAKLDEIVGILS